MWTWGHNTHKLGRPGPHDEPSPVVTVCTGCRAGSANISQLRGEFAVTGSVGVYHTAIVTKTGKLFTWGRGSGGRLGHGSCQDEILPKQVLSLASETVVQVACGTGDDAHTLGTTRYTRSHADLEIALTSDGKVYSWGQGLRGSLGHGNMEFELRPRLVDCFWDGSSVAKLCAGSQVSMVLTQAGSLFTWGTGNGSRHGHSSPTDVLSPTQVTFPGDAKIKDVSLSYAMGIALTTDGRVFHWGSFANGLQAACITGPQLLEGLPAARIMGVI